MGFTSVTMICAPNHGRDWPRPCRTSHSQRRRVCGRRAVDSWPDDAVDGALAGAVAVFEEVLGRRVVDRESPGIQDAVFLHRPQADDASVVSSIEPMTRAKQLARSVGLIFEAHART